MDAAMPAASMMSGYLIADDIVNVEVTPDASTPTPARSAAAHAESM